jgi:RNA polymerase primary sigma factor
MLTQISIDEMPEERSTAAGTTSLSRYLQEIGAASRRSRGEEPQRSGARDQEAEAALVHSSLYLVIVIAQRFHGCELPVEDLIGEGNYGLMRAVKAFNPDRGEPFPSYAAAWISRAMQEALFKAALVPRDRASDWNVRRIRDAVVRLERVAGRYLCGDEIAEACGLPIEEVAEVMSDPGFVSLESRVKSGGRHVLLEILADHTADPTDAAVHVWEQTTCVKAVLKSLLAREAHFIRLYFGLSGDEPKTMQEIADGEGLTRARIGQVLRGALKRLRHPSRMERLQGCR